MEEIIRKLSEMDKKITKGQEDLKLEFQKNQEEIRLLKRDIEKTEKEWEQEKKLLTDRIENLEAKWEIQKKREKKKNIIIKGLQTNEENIEEVVKKLINIKIGVNADIKEARFIGKNEKTKAIIVKIENFQKKLQIMKKKAILKDTNIFIGNELTVKEKIIQNKIKEIAKEGKQNGNIVKIGY
ncbi:hypothetical protein ILUMI_09805 [Ignelater luminosus]|uniref:Uncharacterized protein n=1 Tax=Ignelater luminosus TaxID=2038154 RepID=A0A8K0D1N5_IGNLU|nr:hypothetical protein ILUMI_09805 [Ignelater luminosus]